MTLSSIPVWVKFLHLPLEFWSTKCLSRIASGVGKPLYADKMTEDQQRLGYARVLVEIDTKSVCPNEVTIRRKDGRTVSIEVVYPWLPPKCSSCGGFGHIAYACAKKEVKVWVPKKKGPKVSSPKQKVTKREPRGSTAEDGHASVIEG
jgi:hypothetical protein